MTDCLQKERRKNRLAFYVFLFFFAVYLFSISGLEFNTDSGRERIELVKAIVDRQELTLTQGSDLVGVDGKIYPLRGIAPALLSAPFYIFGKIIGAPDAARSVLINNQLLGAASVVMILLFAVSLGYSLRASALTAIFYGFGTFAWPYSKISFEHTIETFFVLLTLYFMYRYSVHAQVSSLLLSGISFGVAFNTRYSSALMLPAFCLMIITPYLKKYDLWDTVKYLVRDMLLFSTTFLPFLGLSFWYNYARFGSIFETGYTLQAARLGLDFFGGTPLLTGLSGFLISPGKGFFYYSPIAVLFFFSIKSFLRRHPGPGAGFICIILAYLLFLSKNIYWHGDWAWGPRYLLVITPFFIIPLAHLFDSSLWLKNRSLRVAVYVLFAASFIIQVAAVSVDFNKYFFNLIIEEKVEFTAIHGEGVQSIFEPPAERYFEWQKSPILAQFKFIRQMSGEIKNYRYAEPQEGATVKEKIKAKTFMHVFDYWWLSQYFAMNSYSGFIVAGGLLLLSVYAGIKLLKVVIRDG
jgi:4-amino-4-deoxy-L-arabinose transferase-like glycosyltransferase